MLSTYLQKYSVIIVHIAIPWFLHRTIYILERSPVIDRVTKRCFNHQWFLLGLVWDKSIIKKMRKICHLLFREKVVGLGSTSITSLKCGKLKRLPKSSWNCFFQFGFDKSSCGRSTDMALTTNWFVLDFLSYPTHCNLLLVCTRKQPRCFWPELTEPA